MRAATHENQISYKSYCDLGGGLNSDLQKVERRNGSYQYETYHYVGYGEASWKQDIPKGPSESEKVSPRELPTVKIPLSVWDLLCR